MQLNGRTVLVTGANRGVGKAFAEECLARGMRVYAGARKLDSMTTRGVTPVQLDITDPDSVQAAATATGDVEVLVNNAGTLRGASLLKAPLSAVRDEFETNFFGTLQVTRAFAPQLEAAQGGGGLINMLSVLSWVTLPWQGAYCATKAADWSLTNSIRQELHHVQVTAVHVGLIDTDMIRGTAGSKTSPAVVARAALDALSADRDEVLVDEWARRVKAQLSQS